MQIFVVQSADFEVERSAYFKVKDITFLEFIGVGIESQVQRFEPKRFKILNITCAKFECKKIHVSES